MRSRFNEKVEHDAKGVLPMARMLNLAGHGFLDGKEEKNGPV